MIFNNVYSFIAPYSNSLTHPLLPDDIHLIVEAVKDIRLEILINEIERKSVIICPRSYDYMGTGDFLKRFLHTPISLIEPRIINTICMRMDKFTPETALKTLGIEPIWYEKGVVIVIDGEPFGGGLQDIFKMIQKSEKELNDVKTQKCTLCKI